MLAVIERAIMSAGRVKLVRERWYVSDRADAARQARSVRGVLIAVSPVGRGK